MKTIYAMMFLLSGCAEQQGVFRDVNLTVEEFETSQDALDEICDKTGHQFCGIMTHDLDVTSYVDVRYVLPINKPAWAVTHTDMFGNVGISVLNRRGDDFSVRDGKCDDTYIKWFRRRMIHEFIHSFRSGQPHIGPKNVMSPRDDENTCHMTKLDVEYLINN